MRILPILAFLAACGGGGGGGPGNSAQGPVDVRDYFATFAYVTAGGWEDHVRAAQGFELPPERFSDFVCADLAAHGFNTAWLNNIDYALLPMWLDSARRHGIRIIAQGMPLSIDWDGTQWPWPAGWQDRVDREVKEFYRREVPRFRGDPALLAYVIQEESPPQPEIYDKMREVVAVIAEADPTHPVFAEYMWVDSVQMAVQRVRPPLVVFGAGPFPYPEDHDQSRSYCPWTIESSYQHCRTGGVPFWVLTQANGLDVYSDGAFLRRDAVVPTRTQIRWEMWMALMYGAKGVGFFMYSWQHAVRPQGLDEFLTGGLRTPQGVETEAFQEAGAVNRAMAPLRPLLLKLEGQTNLADADYHWSIRGPGVRSRAFVHREDGRRFLMLVNYDFVSPRTAVVPAEFASSGFEDLRTGQLYTGATISTLTLAPGDGTLLRIVP